MRGTPLECSLATFEWVQLRTSHQREYNCFATFSKSAESLRVNLLEVLSLCVDDFVVHCWKDPCKSSTSLRLSKRYACIVLVSKSERQGVILDELQVLKGNENYKRTPVLILSLNPIVRRRDSSETVDHWDFDNAE